ncbi:MAG: CDP-alcohol phosphatidyltransferase family protein [Gammaproteobacteria bacterium]
MRYTLGDAQNGASMKPPESVRTQLGAWVAGAAGPLVHLLARQGITPNHVTVAGCALAVGAALVLMAGYRTGAGGLFLVASLLDLADGALARLTGKATAFGKFLDSTLDRVGEGVMLVAIAYCLSLENNAPAVAAAVLALLGGQLTSYIRARAEVLGLTCTVGVATRPERVAIMVAGLLLDALAIAVYALAAVSSVTVGQRFHFVYKQYYGVNGGGPEQ